MMKLGVGGFYYLDEQKLAISVRWTGHPNAVQWVRTLIFAVDDQQQPVRLTGIQRRSDAQESAIYDVDLAEVNASTLYFAGYFPLERAVDQTFAQLEILEWRFLSKVKVLLVANIPPLLYPVRALILGSLRRENDQWRVEVTAEGLKNGLLDLKQRFGLDLDTLPKEPPAVSLMKPSPTEITPPSRRSLTPPVRNHEMRNQMLVAGAVLVMGYLAWPRSEEPAQVHYVYNHRADCDQQWGRDSCLIKGDFSYSPLRDANLTPPTEFRNGEVLRHCYSIPERCFTDWGEGNCVTANQETCYRHAVVTANPSPNTARSVGGGGGMIGRLPYTRHWEQRPGVRVQSVGSAQQSLGSNVSRPLVVQRGGFGRTARSGFSLG